MSATRTTNAKLRFSAVAFMILIISVAFFLQRRETAALRERLEFLTNRLSVSEADLRKAEENAMQSRTKAEQLQTGLSELPHLRGEVAGLRRQLAERNATEAKLQDQINTVAKEKDQPMPAISAFGTEVRDFGAATPERAATSLIWAATSGNKERLSELLELPASVLETEAPAHYDYFANMLSNNFSKLEFTEIKSVRPNPDGTLRLGIMYRDPESGRTNPFPFMIRQHENGWKVVVEGDVPKKM